MPTPDGWTAEERETLRRLLTRRLAELVEETAGWGWAREGLIDALIWSDASPVRITKQPDENRRAWLVPDKLIERLVPHD